MRSASRIEYRQNAPFIMTYILNIKRGIKLNKRQPRIINLRDIKIEMVRIESIFIVTITHIPTKEIVSARDNISLEAYNKALILLEDIILQKEKS